jgi:hypothetical protein
VSRSSSASSRASRRVQETQSRQRRCPAGQRRALPAHGTGRWCRPTTQPPRSGWFSLNRGPTSTEAGIRHPWAGGDRSAARSADRRSVVSSSSRERRQMAPYVLDRRTWPVGPPPRRWRGRVRAGSLGVRARRRCPLVSRSMFSASEQAPLEMLERAAFFTRVSGGPSGPPALGAGLKACTTPE